MILAHATAVGESGGDGSPLRLVLLIIGLVLLGLAVRLGSSKSTDRKRPPWLPFALGALALLLAVGGAVSFKGKEQKIYLTLLEPDAGAEVKAGQEFKLRINVDGAEVASSPAATTGGHLHLYVNDKLQSMPYGLEVPLTLTAGTHTIKVEFVDEKHAPYDPPIEVDTYVTAVG